LFSSQLSSLSLSRGSQKPITTSAAKAFWESLGTGPHAVGFRVLWVRDHGRHWLNTKPETAVDPGRPIRLSLWYPASPSPGNRRMTYGDYLHHAAPADYEKTRKLDKAAADSWFSDMRELTPPGEPMLPQVLSCQWRITNRP
jgi:hypothetical protein